MGESRKRKSKPIGGFPRGCFCALCGISRSPKEHEFQENFCSKGRNKKPAFEPGCSQLLSQTKNRDPENTWPNPARPQAQLRPPAASTRKRPPVTSSMASRASATQPSRPKTRISHGLSGWNYILDDNRGIRCGHGSKAKSYQ